MIPAVAPAQELQVVYYDHARPDEPQPGFRSGAAGVLALSETGDLVTRERVRLSPNTRHALVGHGVVDALAALPLEVGPLEPDRPALFAPSALDAVARIFFEADRCTYGGVHEFVVEPAVRASARSLHRSRRIQHRIVVDNREYQRGLARLQFLATTAGRQGEAVWLRI